MLESTSNQTPEKYELSERTSSYGTENVRNNDFIQFSRRNGAEWKRLILNHPVAGSIMVYLMNNMRRDNVIIVSSKTLEQELERSRTTISRAVSVLVEQRWVQIIRVGSARAFAVNERVAWRDKADKRKNAIFSATVIANRDEQVSKELNDDRPLKQIDRKQTEQQGSDND